MRDFNGASMYRVAVVKRLKLIFHITRYRASRKLEHPSMQSTGQRGSTKSGMEPLRMAERNAKSDPIGPGQSMKPWRIVHGTDNTRERSLSKIPRTTFAGRIDLVACFALPH